MSADATRSPAYRKFRGVLRFFGYLCMIAVITGVCVWNYKYLILETNDRTPFVLSNSIGEFSDAHAVDPVPRVAILDSATTRNYYRGEEFDYDAVLSTWYDFLWELGLDPCRVSDLQHLDRYDMVVAPYALCLSKRDSVHLKDYVSRGGSIFMTGAVGSRDADGDWLEYPLFGDIAGLRFAGNANPHPYDPASIDLVMDDPLSLNWDTQTRLAMSPYEQVLVAHRAEKRARPLATIASLQNTASEWPLPAMCYGRYANGRYTWAGFRLGAGTGDDDTQRAFKELFTSTLAWLGSLPAVTTRRWPGGAKHSVALVVELTAERSEKTREAIDALNAPLTVAVKASLLDDLDGPPLPPGTDAALILDEEFLMEKDADVSQWLPHLRARASATLGVAVNGILLPGPAEEQAGFVCSEAGFSYVLDEQERGLSTHVRKLAETRRLGPLERPHEIAAVPMRSGWPAPGQPAVDGCIYVDSKSLPSVTAWLDSKRSNTWLTTVYDLAQWDMTRARLRMAREFLPGSRLRIRLSNASYETVKDLFFTIDFYDTTEHVGIWPKVLGLAPPEARALDEHAWQFNVRNLVPGKTAEYVLIPDTRHAWEGPSMAEHRKGRRKASLANIDKLLGRCWSFFARREPSS